MINKPTSSVELTPEQLTELGVLKSRFKNSLSKLMEEKGTHYEELDLSKIWVETDNLNKLYEQLSDLVLCLNDFRPLSPSQAKNLQEVFDIEYTYESNGIEGNTLTLRETYFVVNKGLTIDGKSMNEHLEAINHQDAIDYIRKLAEDKIELTEKELLNIHSLVLRAIDKENAGSYRKGNVRISGSSYVFPNYPKVPDLMSDVFAFYEESKNAMHPVKLAALMHEKIVTVHPFADGNGRTSRLIMNLILMKHGYPITIISSDRKKRDAYYDALEQSQIAENLDAFERLIAQYAKEWLFKYLNMIAPNGYDDRQDKGYEFFKRIENII